MLIHVILAEQDGAQVAILEMYSVPDVGELIRVSDEDSPNLPQQFRIIHRDWALNRKSGIPDGVACVLIVYPV